MPLRCWRASVVARGWGAVNVAQAPSFVVSSLIACVVVFYFCQPANHFFCLRAPNRFPASLAWLTKP